MVKESIHTKEHIEIPMEYDKTKYKIDYVELLNVLVIHRLSDNALVCVSKENPTYAIQIDLENQTHFVIGEYDDKNQYYKFSDYILDENRNFVELKNTFKTDSGHLNDIRIGNHTFKVENSYLYNLKKLSPLFRRIYIDKEIISQNNAILVEKEWFSTVVLETTRYFIDLDTLECISPIYSKLQDRFISIYTQQELEEQMKRKKSSFPINDQETPETLFKITEYMEIKKYLELVEQYLSSPNIYNDSAMTLKKDYVSKFRLKK